MNLRQLWDLIERAARWWCRHFHGHPMRAYRGQYQCAKCPRTYAAPYR